MAQPKPTRRSRAWPRRWPGRRRRTGPPAGDVAALPRRRFRSNSAMCCKPAVLAIAVPGQTGGDPGRGRLGIEPGHGRRDRDGQDRHCQPQGQVQPEQARNQRRRQLARLNGGDVHPQRGKDPQEHDYRQGHADHAEVGRRDQVIEAGQDHQRHDVRENLRHQRPPAAVAHSLPQSLGRKRRVQRVVRGRAGRGRHDNQGVGVFRTSSDKRRDRIRVQSPTIVCTPTNWCPALSTCSVRTCSSGSHISPTR